MYIWFIGANPKGRLSCGNGCKGIPQKMGMYCFKLMTISRHNTTYIISK